MERGSARRAGGMSVDDGIVLVAGRRWAVARRGPGGALQVQDGELAPPPRWLRLPLVRGIAANARQAAAVRDAFRSVGIRRPGYWTFLALGFVLGLATMGVAQGLVRWLQPGSAWEWGGTAAAGLAAFWGYMLVVLVAVSLSGRLLQTFRHHAAEHMAIHAWERAGPAWRDALPACRKEHLRCGHSLLPVWFGGALLADLAVLAWAPPGLHTAAWLGSAVLWPLAMFELLSRPATARLLLPLAAPGLLLQLLSTRRPGPAQLEVAAAAGERVFVDAGEPPRAPVT